MLDNGTFMFQQRFLADAPDGRIAVLRLHLATGEVLRNRIVTHDAAGHMLHHTPLTSEIIFCKWYRGDWYEF